MAITEVFINSISSAKHDMIIIQDHSSTQSYVVPLYHYNVNQGFPGGSVVKNLPANAGDLGLILGREDVLEKEMATHSSIVTWESHGQRSLVGYSPWL